MQIKGKFNSVPDYQGIPLDKKLYQTFPFFKEKNKFFVELGANNGITQSNTKFFEENLYWNGILIEPSFNCFKQCKQIRSDKNIYYQNIISDKDDQIINGDFDGNLMSSVNGKRLKRNGNVKIKTLTLDTIFKNHNIKHVDFLSLDVEGYEFNVLNGINFNETTFSFMLIEIYKWDKEKIIDFLKDKGYNLHSNFTNYALKKKAGWDGTHDDYLFYHHTI